MDPVELLWRLSITAIVVAAPTVLFLLLWRGLMRLRDGEFVQQVLANMEEQPAGTGGADAVQGLQWTTPTHEEDGAVTCRQCGTANAAGYDYCGECANPLPDA